MGGQTGIAPPLKVLDAAAGNGYLANWLDEKGCLVTAVDISVNDKEFNPGVTTLKCDLNRALDLDDNQYDIVISLETIEHLNNPFQFIGELSRVLKKNGLLFLSTPNVHGVRSRIRYLLTGFPSLFEYVTDDGMGQHIMPVNIGMIWSQFRFNSIRLMDIVSTGPPVTAASAIIFRLINVMTSIFNRLTRYQYDKSHVLRNIDDKLADNLYGDIALIVVGKKE